MTCPCPTKRKHPTRRQAVNQMRTAWRTGRGKKLPTRVYKCRCGYWHTTSQARKDTP